MRNPTLISYLEEHKEFQSGHERSSESDERLGESLGGRVIHCERLGESLRSWMPL